MPESALKGDGHYQAYVLRIWREHAHAPWRASLQLTSGGERAGFADIEELAAYLLRLTQASPAASQDSATPTQPH